MKKLKFDLFTFSAYCITIGVTFGSAINFGFVFGTWFYPVLGSGSTADMVVSWVTGGLLGMGAFGLFLKSERAFKTIMRLQNDTEKWIRVVGLVLLNLLFVSIGIAGLYFRTEFLTSKGIGFLLWIGVAVEFLPLLIGLVLWPLQNPDVDVLEDELMNSFERNTIEEAYGTLKSLPLPRRYQAFTGNIEDALDAAVEEIPVEAKKQGRRRPLSSRRGSHGFNSVSMEPTQMLDQPEKIAVLQPETPFLEGLQAKGRNQR